MNTRYLLLLMGIRGFLLLVLLLVVVVHGVVQGKRAVGVLGLVQNDGLVSQIGFLFFADIGRNHQNNISLVSRLAERSNESPILIEMVSGGHGQDRCCLVNVRIVPLDDGSCAGPVCGSE